MDSTGSQFQQECIRTLINTCSYVLLVSGTAVGEAQQNKLRIVSDDVHQQVILDGDLGPAGTFGHFVDTDLTTGSWYILQHRGTTSATFVVTVEVITPA